MAEHVRGFQHWLSIGGNATPQALKTLATVLGLCNETRMHTILSEHPDLFS